jgi:hypothetical protein
MSQPKPKMGRPKLPKGEAKGRVVPIRFNAADLKRIELAAKASQKTVSEWIRGTVSAAIRGGLKSGFQIRTLPEFGAVLRGSGRQR